jgi:hypothetical protein
MNDWEWQLLEDKQPLEEVSIGGAIVRAGDRVRLWPQSRSDIMDLALKGRIAIVESIEQDYEGQAHLAVVIEDDPGREFGMLRQPGHRFFFSAGEVEAITELSIE